MPVKTPLTPADGTESKPSQEIEQNLQKIKEINKEMKEINQTVQEFNSKKATNPQTSTVKEKIAAKPIVKKDAKSTVVHKGYKPGNEAYEMSKYMFERAVYHYGMQVSGKYGAESMVKTFDQESQFRHLLQSKCYRIPGNTCASKGTEAQREQSFGICQLHVRGNDRKSMIVFGKPYAEVTLADMRNQNFSDTFNDKYKQADICIEEWIGASKAGTMPRSAFKKKGNSPIVLVNIQI